MGDLITPLSPAPKLRTARISQLFPGKICHSEYLLVLNECLTSLSRLSSHPEDRQQVERENAQHSCCVQTSTSDAVFPIWERSCCNCFTASRQTHVPTLLPHRPLAFFLLFHLILDDTPSHTPLRVAIPSELARMSSYRPYAYRAAPPPATTMNSDKIRGEWLNFQMWNNAMKTQEETKLQREIQELTTVMERKLATQRWQSNTSMAINQDYEKQTASLRRKMEEQVSSKAREEWHARLERSGLSMEHWTDITSAENAAVAAIEWGAAPKVREVEFDADESCGDTESILSSESSQSKTPTPSIASSRGPQLWTPPETSAELPKASQVPFPSSVQLDNPPPGLRATFTRPDATVPHGPNVAFNGTSSPHTSSPQMSSAVHLPTPRARNVNLKEDRNINTTHLTNIMDTHTPRSSWADDATLAPSQNTTDDESNDKVRR